MNKLIRPLKLSCVAMFAAALPAMAQITNTWNGGGADDNWSTAGNWSPGAPNAGDSLIFDGSTRPTPNNDFSVGTGFGGIQFAPLASAFTLGGNGITFAGLVENDSTNVLQTISLPLVLTNATTFNAVSNLDTTTDDLQVIGGVSGTGSFNKIGGGTMFLSSASHSGGTTVSEGLLVISNNIGNITMAGGALKLNFRTFFINPTYTFTADSSVGIDLLDNTEPRGVDHYGNIGSAGYKVTKTGLGILRMVGNMPAGSINVAEGTLASLGGSSMANTHWGTGDITVENGATLRADDGGICPNNLFLNGGDGTSAGSYTHQGVLVSGSRNNAANPTNNIFTGTITLNSDSTVGSQFGNMIVSSKITGPGGLTKIGGQPLILSGTNDFGGALIVNVGTLKVGSPGALPSGATNGYVQLANNTTLDLNGSNASCNGFIDDGAGLANLDNTAATPAIFTFGNNNTSASFFGAVKNSGGGALSLVYAGNGTASFLGVNTYSGSNVVSTSGGTLDINIPTGTTTGGAVSVADGATLSLHYRVAGSSLKASGATFGSSGATTLTVDLNNYGNPTPPVINATNGSGVLSANGTITVNFNNMANVVVGQFPIIKYTTRTGGGNFVLGSLPGGIVAQIVTNTPNKSIDLQVTSSPITTWKGKLTNNLWDTTTTNWTYSGTPVLYTDGSAVLFDNTALTNIVNLTTTLSPSSTLINSSSNYTFSGTGSLASGDLTKNGTGTLVLDTANTYNNTVISAGTVQVGLNDTVGSLGTGTINDGGTLVFNRSDNLTVSSAISGAGSVVQNNTNILTLSTPNSYNGGTVVAQGVLKITDNNALGVSSSSALVTVSNGATLDIGGRLLSNGIPQYVAISGNGVAANKGALATTSGMGCTIGCGIVGVRYLRLLGDASIGDSTGDFQIGTDVNVSGPAYGSIDGQGFALTKVGNNNVILEATNASALSAFIIAGGSVIYGNGGNNVFGSSCPIVISNNAILDTWDQKSQTGITFANPITIGASGGQLNNTRGSYGGNQSDVYNGSLTLNGQLSVRCSYVSGANGAKTTFNGPISGPGSILVSSGARTVTINSVCTYTGATTVSNTGVLFLSAVQQNGGAYASHDTATMDLPNQTGGLTVPMSALTLGTTAGTTLGLSRVTSLSTTVPFITATNLTLNGTTTVTLAPGLYTTPGQYPLIKYTGSISGGGSLAVGGTGVRGAASISNNVANNSIDLVIPGANPVFWVGNVNTNWDIATTANFKYLGAGTTYQQSGTLGDAVTFDDSTTKTNVFLTTPLSPTTVLVNTTNTYTFSGTNLTGASSLVKNGTGMLILSNLNNNFTAGTFVGGGTLRMGFSSSPTVSFFNSYAGPVTVAAGATLDMGSNNPTAMTINASGAGVAGAGAIQANYPNNAAAFGPSIINQIGNLTVGGTNRWDLRNGSKQWNVNSNGATLTKVGPNYIALVAANISTNLGDITILNGTLDFSTTTSGVGNTNATIYVGNGGNLGFNQFANPVFKSIICSNNAGIVVDGGNTVGQNVISGPFLLQGGTTTIKGNFFNGLYVSNAISGPGSLQLQFQSYLYLAASNTFTGTLNVPNCNASNGGRGTRLSFIGNGSAMTCSQIYLQGIVSGQAYAGWISMDTPTAVLTIATNQQLRGDNGAYVRGSVVASSGSSLAVGQAGNTNYQYMVVGTNMTFLGGSTNYMAIYKTATLTTNSQLYVTNALTLGGTLVIATNGAVMPLVAGDSFKLYFAGSTSGAFTNVGPAPGPGLVWDTSALASSGTISVKAVSVSPTTTSIAYGNNATFTASTTLTSPTYQWYDNNTNVIPGATSAALTLTKPAVAGTGNYTCAISKGGAISTVVAALTVTPVALSITATNISKNFGTTYTFNGTEFVSSGLVTGDSITSVSLTSAGAPSGAAVATYPIVPSAAVGTGLANYNISYNNGTMTVVQTVNLTPTNVVTAISGNTLTLQWPADHIGWFLQSNSVSLVNTSAWFNVTGSDTTNKVNITLDPNKPNVFYRMKY